MMTDETPSTDPKQQIPDLSGLADFQFGPAWARPGARQERPASYPERRSGDRQGGDRRPRRDNREGRQPRGERRVDGQSGERRFNREDRTRGSFRNRRDQTPRSAMAEPTEGLRVELRPVDSGLAALHQEVQKHRRTISLLDLAKVVMGSYDRYDLVFMKQENGPDLYHCKHGDGACFISRQEAVKHLWQSTWMPKYYESVEQEVEAPKGDFKAIAKCSLNNELVGPVNWHGYQSALMNLHRTKFANMPFEAFRSKIVTDKSEEAVHAWQEAVSKRTAWKPVREGASEVLLESPAAVEQDFESNHFDGVRQRSREKESPLPRSVGAPDPIIWYHPPPSQHADSKPLPRVSSASYAYFQVERQPLHRPGAPQGHGRRHRLIRFPDVHCHLGGQ